MRWMWFVAAAVCFAIGFRTLSMGLAAVALLAALGFLLMGTLALVSSRIQTRSQPESAMLGPDELRRIRAQVEQGKRAEAGDTDHSVQSPLADNDASDPQDHDSIGSDTHPPRA